MVLQQVPNHQNPVVLQRQALEFHRFVHIQRDGFLNEHILTCSKRLFCELVVKLGRRRNGHCADGFVFKKGTRVGHITYAVFLSQFPCKLRWIGDRCQSTQVLQVPSNVLTPATTSDEANLNI